MVQSHDLQSLLSLSPHFVPRSRNQPQELSRWSCACVYVCACVCARLCVCVCLCENMHTSSHECVGVFVPVKTPAMKISPAAELLTLIHALCSHAQTLAHMHTTHTTQTHTHLPLLKRHIQWIYCVLSCCLLWMGTAAYLQWIVNPAEFSAVRVLWIANMSYLALLIPLYLPPITSIVRWAKSEAGESKKANFAKRKSKVVNFFGGFQTNPSLF